MQKKHQENNDLNEKSFTEKDAASFVQLFDDFIDKRAKYHYNEIVENNLNIVSEPKTEYLKKTNIK